MLKNSDSHYGWVTILIHWLVAFTVFGLFALGYWMVGLNYYSDWYRTAPHWHKSIGILLFMLMIFRIFWRFLTPMPRPLSTHKRWEKISGHLVHMLSYLLIFTVMLSGYLISTADGRPIIVFNWFEIPSLGLLFNNQSDIAGVIHRYAAYSLLGLAILHGLAAMKHHVIDKDSTLKRMLGRS